MHARKAGMARFSLREQVCDSLPGSRCNLHTCGQEFHASAALRSLTKNLSHKCTHIYRTLATESIISIENTKCRCTQLYKLT